VSSLRESSDCMNEGVRMVYCKLYIMPIIHSMTVMEGDTVRQLMQRNSNASRPPSFGHACRRVALPLIPLHSGFDPEENSQFYRGDSLPNGINDQMVQTTVKKIREGL
jgi:hypothetical protein